MKKIVTEFEGQFREVGNGVVVVERKRLIKRQHQNGLSEQISVRAVFSDSKRFPALVRIRVPIPGQSYIDDINDIKVGELDIVHFLIPRPFML